MTESPSFSSLRLHVGSGPVVLPGWINVDNRPYPGVDHVLDATLGLPFSEVQYIFAEHFLEHLPLAAALRFLHHCRRALRVDGVLRVATPNLDWVWLTHYRHPSDLSSQEAMVACLEINRAFHGWGHRFLYNQTLLTAALQAAGFSQVEYCRYGESSRPALQKLERHPTTPDHPDSPDVLIAEATGKGPSSSWLAEFAALYLRDFEVE